MPWLLQWQLPSRHVDLRESSIVPRRARCLLFAVGPSRDLAQKPEGPKLFKLAVVVKRLPKTRSGKILRGTVRKIADNEPYKMPATIDDPVILDEIKADLIENKILKL